MCWVVTSENAVGLPHRMRSGDMNPLQHVLCIMSWEAAVVECCDREGRVCYTICFSALRSFDAAIILKLHRPGLENLNAIAQPAAISLHVHSSVLIKSQLLSPCPSQVLRPRASILISLFPDVICTRLHFFAFDSMS